MTIFSSISSWLEVVLQPIAAPLTICYLFVLAVLVIYGLHRYWLVFLYHRHARGALTPRPLNPGAVDETSLPAITVQLPMYNEKQVARRVIEAAANFDYPHDLLQIQVLDDSTDDSAEVARLACEQLRQPGGPAIEYIHRDNRDGFKAGALQEGLQTATGEMIAVFDADFVPAPPTLRLVASYFNDDSVGMVQVRWGHLNRFSSLLTRIQAILLDGHFVIEHTARNRAGRWFNFNGTAGVWRRTCIEDAGGWQHDTLTEDMDLSYRAQLKGWKFVYDPSIVCDAELPPHVTDFKSQQHRWTKGSIQTAIKLLPTIMTSDASLATKIEAWFHLTSPIVYPFVVLLSLLFFPAFFVNIYPVESGTAIGWLFGLTLFGLATASAGTFYVVSQIEQHKSGLRTILQLPSLMALGIGISINNSRAVLEALLGIRSPFVRTQKYGTSSAEPAVRRTSKRLQRIAPGLIELTLGCLMLLCITLSFSQEHSLVSIPFLALFAAGYLSVGWGTLYRALGTR
ncbi:MAG: glycosyltransferase [Planctomycetes bacterium]|nr:glycosyltransferase [Planctomycetota bacterium]NOG54033.1 glycosyltransferase [Planctomycetota bacterium]